MFPILQYMSTNEKHDKRSIHDNEKASIKVKLNTHGNKFSMNLKKNKMVISPSFHVEALDEKGEAIHKHKLNNCYYQGKLDGIDGSMVTLSTCNGLVS